MFRDTATEEQLNRLRKQSQEIGSTTAKTATDAANAQVALARLGLDANEVLAATPHVVDLAIAGLLDMEEAAGLVGKQLSAFRLDSGETQRVVDVLAETAATSATNVKELGPAMRNIAPIAGSLKIPLEDVAGSLGMLRNLGVIPSQAGTGLRQLVQILSRPATAPARRTFERWGVAFEEVQKKLLDGDLFGAFDLIRQAGADFRGTAEVFGAEAVIAGNELISNLPAVREYADSLRDASGAGREMAETMARGLPGAWAAAKSALEAFQLRTGESGLTGILRVASEAMSWFFRTIAEIGPIQVVRDGAAGAGANPDRRRSAAGLHVVRAGGISVGDRRCAAGDAALRGRSGNDGGGSGLCSHGVSGRRPHPRSAPLGVHGKGMPGVLAAAVGVIWAKVAALWASVAGYVGAAIAQYGFVGALWVGVKAALAFTAALLTNPFVLLAAGHPGLSGHDLPLQGRNHGAFTTAWNWLKQSVEDVIDFVRSHWRYILPILLGPLGLIIVGVEHFKDDIIGVFRAVWGGLETAVRGIRSVIVGVFAWLREKYDQYIGSWLGDVLNAVGSVAGVLAVSAAMRSSS